MPVVELVYAEEANVVLDHVFSLRHVPPECILQLCDDELLLLEGLHLRRLLLRLELLYCDFLSTVDLSEITETELKSKALVCCCRSRLQWHTNLLNQRLPACDPGTLGYSEVQKLVWSAAAPP